jgi:hypothetical protein
MDNIDRNIRFDTVRFVTNSAYLSNINDNLFEHIMDMSTREIISAEFQSERYSDVIPFKLYIRINYKSNRTTIEFSSKILFADYPLLISAKTFRQCLLNIETLGICKLDIDSIIKDCYFNKLHITKDIDLKLTTDILNRLNQCTGEYRRYKWVKYEDGILFTKDVKTKDCKEALTVYDKEIEIALPKNKAFLDKTGNITAILNYFQNKTRFEVKLESKRKIQKELSIVHTDFDSVMNVQKNIPLSQFDKIFTSNISSTDLIQIKNIVDFGLWGVIRYHDFDLKKIEQEIKDIKLYKDKTKGAMGKQMKKIKSMIQAYHNQNHNADSVIDGLRKKLKE